MMEGKNLKRPTIPGHDRPWPWALLLFALAVLAYLPATRCAFIWDDDQHLMQNPCIAGPLGLKEIWTSAQARICPLVLTTFWVEHRLWGFDPLGYHVVTVAMHAGAALVLWRVLLVLKVRGAWLGAALWVLHPVQVESVAWITEMKNTQSGLFFLLSILFYCKCRVEQRENGPRNRSRFLYGLTLLFGAMAMASKSSTVVLPLVLGLCAWWMEGRWRWRRDLFPLAPLLLMSALAGVLSIWTQKLEGSGEREEWALNGPQRLVVAGRAVWFYLGKLIWPHPLIMIYPRWEITTASAAAWLPLLAAAVLSVVLWLNRNAWNGRGRALWLAWAYFVVALLPVLGLLNHGFLLYSFVGDHFQYLASMGPLALIGAGINIGLDGLKRSQRWLQPAFCSLVLLTLGILTWRQCAGYQNQKTLWTVTLAENPSCWMAHNNLGIALQQIKQLEGAKVHFQKAIEISSDYSFAHFNLGNVLWREGRLEEALAHYDRGLKIRPENAALQQKERLEEALAHYQKALESNPGRGESYDALGDTLQQAGRRDEAMLHYRKVLADNPDNGAAHKNLGVLLEQEGLLSEGATHYQKAIEINPNDAQSLNNLAHMLATSDNARLRDGAKAVELAQRASQLTGGSNPGVLGILAAAQAEAGNFPGAMETAQRAIGLAETQGNSELVNLLQQHLKGYQKWQPLRETP